MNDSRAGKADQKKENPKFMKFFIPILMIFLNLELSDRVHLDFKCLDTTYPEANNDLGVILSILRRLKDNRINLALI